MFLSNIITKIRKAIRLAIKKPLKYKIGNLKQHNSLVDSLIPQYVEIGDNFISAPGSIILAHDASLFMHTGEYRVEKTKIGDNVFLGANAVIMPGVVVGNGVIIGAGSVVTKNIPEYMVAAGNPARVFCTVTEYLEKCCKKNILVKAPDSFQKLKIGIPLVVEDILAFQDVCLSKTKNKT